MLIISYWAKRPPQREIEMCGVFANRDAFTRFKRAERHRGWTIVDDVVLLEDKSKTVDDWLEEQRKAGRW